MAVKRYRAALTPAAVGAATVAEQAFTIPDLNGNIGSAVVVVSKPSTANAVGLGSSRISSATQISIQFVNPTAGALTPTAGEVYQIAVID